MASHHRRRPGHLATLAVTMLIVDSCAAGSPRPRPRPTSTVPVPDVTTTPTSADAAPPTCEVPTPEATPATTEIHVFFFCGGGLFETPLVPVARRVPQTASVLQAVMEAWVGGPTPQEKAAGISYGGVPSAAARAEVGVRLRQGTALVAIGVELNTIENFSTSNVSGMFYRGLQANAFQFATVRAVAVVGQCPGENVCDDSPDGPRTPDTTRAEWGRRERPCPPPSPVGSLCWPS